MDDRGEILARLRRLGDLLFARDLATVDEMWGEGGFVLYGSEQGESVHTRDELARLFEGLYSRPFRIRWRWDGPEVTISGNVAWLTSEGQLELVYPNRTESRPYRIVAIFEKAGSRWRWRLYSGSEPVQQHAADG